MVPLPRFFAAVLLGAAMSLPAFDANAEATVLKFGGTSSPHAAHNLKVMVPYLHQVERDSAGTIKFQEFFGGALIRASNKQFEGVVNGIQDLSLVVPSLTQKLFPEIGVFTLPFLIEGTGAYKAGVAGWKLHERKMLSGLDRVRLLAVVGTDNYGFHLSRKIETIDQIAGLKIVSLGAVGAQAVAALGASGVAMGPAQIAESLNRGVVQGSLNSWAALEQFRIEPLIKTHVDIPMGAACLFLVMSNSSYDRLPSAGRKAIDMNSGLPLTRSYSAFLYQDAKRIREEAETSKDRNVIHASPAELKALAAKFKSIHDSWIANTPNGDNVYRAVREILPTIQNPG